MEPDWIARGSLARRPFQGGQSWAVITYAEPDLPGLPLNTTAYCGAESNDHPHRPRRDGYKLHLAACGTGNSSVTISDYYYGIDIARYIVNVGSQEEIDEED